MPNLLKCLSWIKARKGSKDRGKECHDSFNLSGLGHPPLWILGYFTKASNLMTFGFHWKWPKGPHSTSWEGMKAYTALKGRLSDSSVLPQTILVISLTHLALKLPITEVMTLIAFSRNQLYDLLGSCLDPSWVQTELPGWECSSCKVEWLP